MVHWKNIKGSTVSEKTIFLQIFKELEAGKLELPVLPDLAIKIRDTLRDPTVSIEDASKLVTIDQSLTAYIIKIANSPLYGGIDPCNDVQSAIIRLGYNSTRNISMTYVLRSMFRPKLRKLIPHMQKLWLKVSNLAALSAVLAERTTDFEHEMALTAGMMQDIGALPIITKLSRYPDVFNQPEEVAQIIDRYTARVGALMLRKWNFQEEMVEVVRSRKDWMRDKSENADLADIVLLARLHSYVGTPQMRRHPALYKVPAFKKVGLDKSGPKESIDLLIEAKQEVAEIKQLLPMPDMPIRRRSKLL